jgi:hypothetical protein
MPGKGGLSGYDDEVRWERDRAAQRPYEKFQCEATGHVLATHPGGGHGTNCIRCGVGLSTLTGVRIIQWGELIPDEAGLLHGRRGGQGGI